MPLNLEEQSRVTAFATQLAAHQQKLAATAAPPVPAPLFVKYPDGSISTRRGVQVRGPVPPAPAKGS